MFKTIAIAVAVAAAGYGSAARASDWKKVAWSVEKQAEMDVDRASLDRTDPSKPIVLQRTRTAHGSTEVLVQYDCAGRSWAPLSMHGKATRLVDEAGNTVSMPVKKHSMAEAAYDYVCRDRGPIDGPDFRGNEIEYRGGITHSHGPATH